MFDQRERERIAALIRRTGISGVKSVENCISFNELNANLLARCQSSTE